MKRVFLLLSLVTVALTGYAQESPAYVLGKTTANVDCYYTLSKCNGKTTVLLRFNNRNAAPVTLTWKEVFTTKQIADKKNGLRVKQVKLAPGISGPLHCEDAGYRDYIIGEADVNYAYRADITGFEFTDVSVTAE